MATATLLSGARSTRSRMRGWHPDRAVCQAAPTFRPPYCWGGGSSPNHSGLQAPWLAFLSGPLLPAPWHVGSVFQGNRRNCSACCSDQNLTPQVQESPALTGPTPHFVLSKAPAPPRGGRPYRGSRTRTTCLRSVSRPPGSSFGREPERPSLLG